MSIPKTFRCKLSLRVGGGRPTRAAMSAEMAGATTLPTSPNAAAPPQKDESGAQAAEAAHGGCLPSQWLAEESACASGASCEPMSGQDLCVDALAVDGAARAAYAVNLQDMSPPWLLRSFP